MQTEFYRDLVTPVDPTSRFSFLNYVKLNGRLDQFFCSSTIYPTRREFEDYFNWVANQIVDIVCAANVHSVDYNPETNLFIVEVENESQPQRRYELKHIVLGCGAGTKSTSASSKAGRVVGVSALLGFDFPNSLERILVVGGGQSAAECVNYLLDQFAADRNANSLGYQRDRISRSRHKQLLTRNILCKLRPRICGPAETVARENHS